MNWEDSAATRVLIFCASLSFSNLPYFCSNLSGCHDSVALVTFFFFSCKPSAPAKKAMLCAGGQGMSVSHSDPTARDLRFSSDVRCDSHIAFVAVGTELAREFLRICSACCDFHFWCERASSSCRAFRSRSSFESICARRAASFFCCASACLRPSSSLASFSLSCLSSSAFRSFAMRSFRRASSASFVAFSFSFSALESSESSSSSMTIFAFFLP